MSQARQARPACQRRRWGAPTSRPGGRISGRTAAQGWVEVPAQVLRAKLKTEAGRKAEANEATASRAYSFGGRTYESSRLGVATGGDNIVECQRVQHRAQRRS